MAVALAIALGGALGACGDDGGSDDGATTDEPAETTDRDEASGGDASGQLNVQGLDSVEGGGLIGTNTGSGTGTQTGDRTGDGYDDIQDLDGYIEVSVPPDWSDRQGGSPAFSDPDGSNANGVILYASTNVNRFSAKWGVPGMSVAATSAPFQIGQIDGLIDANVYPDDCEGGGQKKPYDDGVYVGKIATYKGCGGTTEYTVVAAQPADATYIVLVTIAIPEGEADSADREQVLDTFRVLRTPPGLI
jgi:hypothetical protein